MSNSKTVFNEIRIPFMDAVLNVHTHVKRSTQPIILIHGIGVSSRYMLPLATELSKTHPVYAIDLPGFGKSTLPTATYDMPLIADSISTLIKHEKLSNPILIGNSFGCQVILKFFKNHPQIVSKAVLVDPTIHVHERNYRMQVFRWLQNIKHEPVKKWLPVFTKDIMDCGIIHVHRTLHIALKDKPEENIQNLQGSILLMRGELDSIAPKMWLEYLGSQNNRCMNAEIPHAGHALNFNSPRRLAKAIREFIHTSFV